MREEPRISFCLEARDGVRDILPLIAAALPIGLLCGALGVSKGLAPAEVVAMSMLVFAGGAQFAALEIWRTPAPILLLAFSTLLINARHILMSASLAPKTGLFSPLQRFLGFAVLADENWALSERRASTRALTPAYFLTMGAVFWANWVIASTLGAIGGSFLGDPRRLGADFAFPAVFIGLIAGFWKGRTTAITVVASALVSAFVYLIVGPPWHVACGALAGIIAAYLAAPADSGIVG
ncbi:MAG: AzlC family ABC transporter permease [Methylobacteriaceae bacterium]|nr:AzlC family ABC transporter permease [Methylobacteriaceae bacterium]